MNISNQKLNWLTITASGLCASVLLITDARAAETLSAKHNSTTTAVSYQNSDRLVARRSKKKKQLKRKVQKRVRTTATAPTTTTELTQTPPIITPTPAEPAPPTPPNPVAPPAPTAPVTPTEPPKTESPNQFSLTTKLKGEVIFGATGTFVGDFSRNTAFGHRTRLELSTGIGAGTLTTRLQSSNLGSATAAAIPPIPEGRLSWTGDTDSIVRIDALKYQFPLTPQTQVVVAANAGASDDFTDTINPYFDGDGGSGSISAFGNRPSIYYTVQGAGVGIRHKLSDSTEFSLGYLASTSNNPTTGGLFGGNYGALAQLTFKTGENSKVGVTYTRTLNADPNTGSMKANMGGTSNNFGLQGSFQLNPQFALGGWAGYTQNQADGVDRQIWNWAITAAAPDLGGKGNLAGLLVGQEPRVTFASNGTADTKAGLHIEGFYQFKVNDNFSITPGIIYLTAPNQDANSRGAAIGVLRSTFTF